MPKGIAALKRRLGAVAADVPPQTAAEPAAAYVSRLDRLLQHSMPVEGDKPKRRGGTTGSEHPVS